MVAHDGTTRTCDLPVSRMMPEPPCETRRPRFLVVAACLALVACQEPSAIGPQGSLADFISAVTTASGQTAATSHAGAAPAPGAGVAPLVPGNGTVVNGGSSLLRVRSAVPFNRVVVTVDGLDGYYDLILPASDTAATVLLRVSPGQAKTLGSVRVAVGSGAGVGAFALYRMQVYRVGTGDVQISVNWTGASDVDLHVTDPGGAEVSFADTVVASGGRLDLDSNPGCTLDNINNENVYWPAGGAPHGTYQVVLDYFNDCGVARTDYVVTVAMAGQPVRTFTGSFAGSFADNEPKVVGSFTY